MVLEDNAPSSRAVEESRLVATWLERLRDTVGQERAELYENALARFSLSEKQLQSGLGLRQRDLDNVLAFLRPVIPDVTLRLFARTEILDLGLVGYAAINSDTIGTALRVMNEYHSLASDRYTDQLLREDRLVRVLPTPLPKHGADFQNICEDSFSGNWRALNLLLGPRADIEEVVFKFEYREPDHIEAYKEVLGPNCEFGAESTGLFFPITWLDLPVHRGSAALSGVYTAMCERVLGPGESRHDPAQQVRRLLLSRAGREMLSLEKAAEQLRLTEGQLRKRLYRVGTSYKKIVLEVRMELSRHYLLDTHLSVQEIAYLLGYGTPAPFSRAFKRTYGIAPQHFRMRVYEKSRFF